MSGLANPVLNTPFKKALRDKFIKARDWESQEERVERLRSSWSRFRELNRNTEEERPKPKKPDHNFAIYIGRRRQKTLTKKLLREFWDRFRDSGTGAARLHLLQEMSFVKIDNRLPRKVRRYHFTTMQSSISRFGRCGCCREPRAYNRHHIIQLQNGGPNLKINLILLCDWCHSLIHDWLPKPATKPESMSETMKQVNREP